MHEITKTQVLFWSGANLIAAALLFWATEPHSYDYYTLLRWAVCAVAVGSGWAAFSVERRVEPWLYGAVALLFNPLIPVHLSRSTWQPIDIVVGIGFVVSALEKLRFLKSAPSESLEDSSE